MSKANELLHGTTLTGKPATPPGLGELKARMAYPPFSVWNTRDGHWMSRRRKWVSRGIKSEVGRDAVSYESQDRLSAISGEYAAKADAPKGPNKKIEPGGGGGPNSKYIRRGGKKKKRQKVGEAFGHSLNGMYGRDDEKGDTGSQTGTSIFDPVVCELAYSWWCPPGGIVVDPFAGGSVRGVVASLLGLKYWGSELREVQVRANKDQLTERTRGQYKPKWICGDSYETLDKAPRADFILSCPPYGDLEQYSDDPADISGMKYPEFLKRYGAIIEKAVGRLKPNRFIVWVVANYRERKTGKMRDFVGDTIRAFAAAGADFYNDIVLVNSIGSGPMRANTNFVRGNRKMVKLHQNVLVFIKGDPAEAAKLLEGNNGSGTSKPDNRGK